MCVCGGGGGKLPRLGIFTPVPGVGGWCGGKLPRGSFTPGGQAAHGGGGEDTSGIFTQDGETQDAR